MNCSASEKAIVIHQDCWKTIDEVDGKESMSPKDTQEFYDKWATSYDDDIDHLAGGYNNPERLVEVITEFVPNRGTRILDIACGTGRVGRILRDFGYDNVDGLDGSSSMLNIARKENIYKNYFQEIIEDSPMKTVDSGTFDIVATTGSFTRNHLSAKCLKPLGQCLKKKGLFIMMMREAFLELPDFEDLEPRMAALEEQKFWTQIHRGTVANYIANKSGVYYVFEKL